MSVLGRAYRRRMRQLADEAHVAWAEGLRTDNGASRRVSMSAWEPVYRDATGEGDMVFSHLQVVLYREDGTREALEPHEDADPMAAAYRLRKLRNR